ncbi:porin family protein [Sphingobacterium athyrii]|uniref:PorT family protein n=2 Tax=Sphingobacterium TaxID=28453 RepID=A0A363NZD6_9SPHI|nr:porin family protein [Sphingobacterium athyrii]PUV26184.1 PorT family protein [Sphingobacterium athyrii]
MNRKTILSCVVLFAMMLSKMVFAQEQPRIQIGIKGGSSLNKLNTELADLDDKYALGLHLGGMARVNFGSAYIQGEALFSKRKAALKPQGQTETKLKWNAIDIPVMVGYKFIQQQDMNLRVFAGAVYNYTLNDNLSPLKAIKEGVKHFDKSNIQFTGGLGVDIQKFSIDFRYERGFSDLSNSFKSKPQAFSIGVGYFLF